CGARCVSVFFQAEDGILAATVTGVQTCALPIWTPIGLITKGTMVLRDIDVLGELSRRAKTTVCFSVPTVDETVWAKTEPGTPPRSEERRVGKGGRYRGAAEQCR